MKSESVPLTTDQCEWTTMSEERCTRVSGHADGHDFAPTDVSVEPCAGQRRTRIHEGRGVDRMRYVALVILWGMRIALAAFVALAVVASWGDPFLRAVMIGAALLVGSIALFAVVIGLYTWAERTAKERR